MTRPRSARLRPLLLALVLAAPATSGAAQTAIPATPGSRPAPAVPAAAPVLTVTAPAGTAAEYVTRVSVRVSLSDVQVSAVPGGGATEADLNAARRAFAGLGNLSRTLQGKAFYRVASRLPGGGARLVATTVQGAPAVTLTFTQDLSPAGRGSNLRVTSTDPQLDHALSALDDEQVQALAQEHTGTVYGIPLVTGQPRTVNATVDLQALLSRLLGPLGGDALGQVEAAPLNVTSTTTYQGTGPQGEFLFGTRATAGSWTLRVPGGSRTGEPEAGPIPELAFELTDLKASGAASYRRDGLPLASTQRQQTRLNALIRQDGVQVRLVMTLEQTAEVTPR